MEKKELLRMACEVREKRKRVVRGVVDKVKKYMKDNDVKIIETNHIMYNGNNWYILGFDPEWGKDVWIPEDSGEVVLQYAEEILERIS